MISAKFEDEIWIYFQTNLRARTRKEYWNVIRSFDKLTGHDPLKLTRKDAMNYYNSLIEKVNSGRLSYNTAVMRLSVMKSVCTFIETYTINHGKRYVNYFESMSLPEQDKIFQKDELPDTKKILGYVCKKAKTTINSNTIELWYTNDLKLNAYLFDYRSF